MIVFQYCLFLMVAAALATGLAPRLKLPLELLLLIGSIVVSLIPGVPYVSLPPDIIFYVLLPPILFAAAFFTSLRDFFQNIRPIMMLAIGLVLVTTLGVGYLVHYLIPDMPLAVAFLLGAIVSPPDAAAAAAFAKQLHLPRRVVTILEGESLINDATALVVFRFALAAVMTNDFSLPSAIGSFFLLAIGGGILGFAVAVVGIRAIRSIHNPTAEVLVSLITAFFAYLLAEKFHLSGVIATVVAGAYFGRKLSSVAEAQTRMEARSVWNVVLLAINGLVFTVIGLQLPTVLTAALGFDPVDLLWWTILIVGLLILIRFAWVFTVTYIARFTFRHSVDGHSAILWKHLVIISWTGMRGIVTLATVLAIPETLADGSAFPYREICFLISYGVIILTLIIPSFTLPLLVRKIKLPEECDHEIENLTARLTMAEGVLELLRKHASNTSFYTERLIEKYTDFTTRLQGNLQEELAHSTLNDDDLLERKNIKEILKTERHILHILRKERKIHDEIFHELEDELDIEEIRLKKNTRPIF